MRLRILGSGSKGNSCLIRTKRALFLLDNGFSGKEITRRLESLEVDPRDINGIIVSHEHNDHVSGVGIFSRRYKTPIYINRFTYTHSRKKLSNTEIRFFESGKVLHYKDLIIDTFPISHDASDPVGFIFSQKNCAGSPRLGFVTDLGQVTKHVREKLRDIQALVMESNHDEKMLLNGPYPWATKQRIRGDYGHLSNKSSAELISDVVELTGINEVTLAHLSENNNDPVMAEEYVLKTVEQQTGKSIRVHVAGQRAPMENEIILEKENIE